MNELIVQSEISSRIFTLRAKQVMLDRGLAALYHVETKVLNQAVKRNIQRFPNDFMFQLNDIEKSELVTNCDRFKNLKYSTVNPYAFTEQGVYMLATVLNSDVAIDVNIAIMRTFTKLREFSKHYNALAKQLIEIDRKHDKQYKELKKSLDELIATAEVAEVKVMGFSSMTALRDLHKDDKPREKLVVKGVQALKNDELLAILLGSGVQGKDVRKLAREIVVLMDRHFDKLSDQLTLKDLCEIHGLGVAKASQILASIELSKRYLIRSNKRITSAKDVYEELKEFSTKNQEHFLSITLDGASHIINTRTVFIGTLNQSMVHPREVFADAIADRAAGIIIAHNHPSGTLEASRADMEVTGRLKEVSKLVGIELLDHVILSKHGYYSFSDEGLL